MGRKARRAVANPGIGRFAVDEAEGIGCVATKRCERADALPADLWIAVSDGDFPKERSILQRGFEPMNHIKPRALDHLLARARAWLLRSAVLHTGSRPIRFAKHDHHLSFSCIARLPLCSFYIICINPGK
jgi:hypothetical protein